MSKTAEKRIKITLSDLHPVTIRADQWPILVHVSDFWGGNGIECQANEEACIKIRQHADGRAIVYGIRDSGPGGMPLSYRGRSAGFLLSTKEGQEQTALIRAIRRVAGAIDWQDGAARAIAELPPTEL